MPELLSRLGVHWLYELVLPGFFFMWLAKREERVIPEEAKRRLYARGYVASLTHTGVRVPPLVVYAAEPDVSL